MKLTANLQISRIKWFVEVVSFYFQKTKRQQIMAEERKV
jgi:hypothetical protein